MSDLAQLRRWQADEYEKKNQPRLGELNIPQILRDDADEIERLREEAKPNWVVAERCAKLEKVLDAAGEYLYDSSKREVLQQAYIAAAEVDDE